VRPRQRRRRAERGGHRDGRRDHRFEAAEDRPAPAVHQGLRGARQLDEALNGSVSQAEGQQLAGRTVAPPIYEDEANDPAVGAQKTQKFIEQDQVDVMMGIVATPIAYAVRNAIDSAKMIFIETNAGGNALTRDTVDCKPSCKSKYIFRSSFSSYQISYPIGEYFSTKKGVKEVFTFIADYAFGTESAADFTSGFAKGGGKVTGGLRAPLNTAELRSLRDAAEEPAEKDIYSFFSGTDAINYIKAWNQLGMPAAGYRMNGKRLAQSGRQCRSAGAVLWRSRRGGRRYAAEPGYTGTGGYAMPGTTMWGGSLPATPVPQIMHGTITVDLIDARQNILCGVQPPKAKWITTSEANCWSRPTRPSRKYSKNTLRQSNDPRPGRRFGNVLKLPPLHESLCSFTLPWASARGCLCFAPAPRL